MHEIFTQAEIDEADTQASELVLTDSCAITASLASLVKELGLVGSTPDREPSPSPSVTSAAIAPAVGSRLNIPDSVINF
jgi:hypothetical protein|tara:strand:- start:264 stop:500 length:237 start_codon:yes stop_codon:yes gene_type:complete